MAQFSDTAKRFRPHAKNAAYCYRRHTFRGLSVYFWRALQKRMNRSIEMQFGADCCGPKEPCIRWDAHWRHL